MPVIHNGNGAESDTLATLKTTLALLDSPAAGTDVIPSDALEVINAARNHVEAVTPEDLQHGREARMRAAGLASLLSEVLANLGGKLDPDLRERIDGALADQARAVKAG